MNPRPSPHRPTCCSPFRSLVVLPVSHRRKWYTNKKYEGQLLPQTCVTNARQQHVQSYHVELYSRHPFLAGIPNNTCFEARTRYVFPGVAFSSSGRTHNMSRTLSTVQLTPTASVSSVSVRLSITQFRYHTFLYREDATTSAAPTSRIDSARAVSLKCLPEGCYDIPGTYSYPT